jgi:hypothetical protein
MIAKELRAWYRYRSLDYLSSPARKYNVVSFQLVLGHRCKFTYTHALGTRSSMLI